MAAPEPPDDLLDIIALHVRARRRRQIRAAGLSATVVAVASVTAAGALHLARSNADPPTRIMSPPSPTPTAITSGPPANDVITSTDCRASVHDHRLAATFALDTTDRFDPPAPTARPAHTAAQVLAAYKPGPYAGDTASQPQVFLATHSTQGHGYRQVWAVVTYHVAGPPSMGPGQTPPPTATKTDEIQSYDPVTLRPISDLYAMPISCG
jgi:hypothetical protein